MRFTPCGVMVCPLSEFVALCPWENRLHLSKHLCNLINFRICFVVERKMLENLSVLITMDLLHHKTVSKVFMYRRIYPFFLNLKKRNMILDGKFFKLVQKLGGYSSKRRTLPNSLVLVIDLVLPSWRQNTKKRLKAKSMIIYTKL